MKKIITVRRTLSKAFEVARASQSTLPFILSRSINYVSCNRMSSTSLGWRHLVNVYGVKAGWFIRG